MLKFSGEIMIYVSSLSQRASDFFRERPAVQILTLGAASLLLSRAINPLVLAAGSLQGSSLPPPVARTISSLISSVCILGPLIVRERPEQERRAVEATVSAVLAGVTGSLSDPATPEGKFGFMVAAATSFLSGLVSASAAGDGRAPRDYMATAAATAGVIAAFMLMQSSGPFETQALAALTILGNCFAVRGG